MTITDWTEPFITKQQLANQLGFSTRWVEKRVNEGMPSYLMGGRRRFQRSQAVNWLLDQHQANGNQQA